jgi:hypothetical protein
MNAFNLLDLRLKRRDFDANLVKNLTRRESDAPRAVLLELRFVSAV